MVVADLRSTAIVCSSCSEGGYFPCTLEFPKEYPNKPPVMTFTSKGFWHPNGACVSANTWKDAPLTDGRAASPLLLLTIPSLWTATMCVACLFVCFIYCFV